MRKIAFVIGGLPFGGVENWLLDIALRMKRGGTHACRIFNVSGTGVKMPEFEAAGLDVVCIGNSNASASTHRLDTALRLRRELKRYDPDLIHTLHFSGDYFGRIAAMGLGVPVITHLRNVKREKKPVRRFANKFLSRFTDAYISISRAVEKTVELDHNMCGRRQFVLYNAIDTSRLDCDAHDLRGMYGLKGPVVIGVGRYVEQKNFESLIRAMKILADQGQDADLVLVGEGSRRDLYESLIRDLDLGGKVVLTGYRRDVGAFLRGADILAMPSLFEGFGNVHLEAMHCGVPGVISQFVPSLEIGAEASVVSDCSAGSIAAGIASLLDDPEKYRELVEKGRRIVPEYTIERYLERLYGVYDEVLTAS
jgi:glycosyltransferase involved in cell wall biosynthesis